MSEPLDTTEILLIGLFVVSVALVVYFVTKRRTEISLKHKINELQTNTDIDPQTIRNLLNNDSDITLGELITQSQDVAHIYESYIVKKYKDDSVLSFPATFFFNINGELITEASSSIINSGNPTTEGVEFMISTKFLDNIIVNLSICGKISNYNELIFVVDLNIHPREQIQGVMVCSKTGSKFVTVCISEYFDTIDNKLKSKIKVHPQGISSAISLPTGTEFFILCSYKVYNENITALDTNLDKIIINQNNNYCR